MLDAAEVDSIMAAAFNEADTPHTEAVATAEKDDNGDDGDSGAEADTEADPAQVTVRGSPTSKRASPKHTATPPATPRPKRSHVVHHRSTYALRSRRSLPDQSTHRPTQSSTQTAFQNLAHGLELLSQEMKAAGKATEARRRRIASAPVPGSEADGEMTDSEGDAEMDVDLR